MKNVVVALALIIMLDQIFTTGLYKIVEYKQYFDISWT